MIKEQIKGTVTAGYLKKVFKENNVPDDAVIVLISPKDECATETANVIIVESKVTHKIEVMLMPSLRNIRT